MHVFIVDIFGLTCGNLYSVLHRHEQHLSLRNNTLLTANDKIFAPFRFLKLALFFLFLVYGQENVTSHLNISAEHAFCYVVNNAEKTQVPVSLYSQCLQLWCIIT